MQIKTRVKVTEHFYLDEFWDRNTYIMNDEDMLRSHLNIDFINDIEKLRVRTGCILTINDWFNGGTHQWRGNRNPNCNEYTPGSMHSFKMLNNGQKVGAYDILTGFGGEYLRQHIRIYHNEYPNFKRMEKDVNWLHVDTKIVKGFNHNKGIYEFF